MPDEPGRQAEAEALTEQERAAAKASPKAGLGLYRRPDAR